MSQSLLSFKNVGKSFAGNKVLKNVSIDIKPGEIHALIGENGAGKSTLMNILFGMPVIHRTGGFDGRVEIEGKEVKIKTPHEAINYGIGMVHQEFMLIPGFTVTENIKLNREITKENSVNSVVSKIFGKRMQTMDMEKMSADARAALKKLNMDIEEYTLIAGLPIGHMQFVEIAREIDKLGIKLLVLDEPTAVLAESEAAALLQAMKNLANSGISIIFISHRLSEIIQVSDRVSIMRDGELVVTKDTADTCAEEIAELMIGRSVNIERESTLDRRISDEILMEIKDLHVGMPGEMVHGVDLKVRAGEILGIGGLAGQGKLGIANGVMGIYPARGEVTFAGQPLALNKAKETLSAGIGYVSEDRKGIGLLLDESIELNIVFTAMQVQDRFLRHIGPARIHKKAESTRLAEQMIRDLDIRCTSASQHTCRLSGGNQQKVCVARALTQDPQLLFVSEPTRGIDIGAKKLILDLLLNLSNERGMTIIMTSSELAELRSICDRIVIICEGKVEGELPPDASNTEFGLMMSGHKMEGGEAANG